MKFDLAKRIASGRSRMGGTTLCKIVTVLVGDNPLCTKDINRSLVLGIPLIVLDGSPLVQSINDLNMSN